jgi:6-phosphogluconolactonase
MVTAGLALQIVSADVRGKQTAQLRIAADAVDLSRLAAEEFVDLTSAAVNERGLSTVALAGGSTPRNLYELLADESEPYRTKLPWTKIHFFWGDERHVPPDHLESNYRMARETLLAKAPVPLANVHRIKGELANADLTATDYERAIREFFGLGDGQSPKFDLVLLGVGPDGHTASIFPGSDAINEKNRLVAAPWVQELESYRITLTLPVLNNASAVTFLVSGAEKSKILQQALEGDYETDHLPVQLINPTNGKLLWLVDREASQLLSD